MHVKAALSLAVIVFILDQVTKEIVLAVQASLPVAVLPFFNLVLVWNQGVSFGMFGGENALSPLVLVGVAVLVSAGLLYWLWHETSALAAMALGLVLGGAVGNVVDRLRHGAVVDFLDFHLAGRHWPSFNTADSAIVVGAVLLAAGGLVTRKQEASS